MNTHVGLLRHQKKSHCALGVWFLISAINSGQVQLSLAGMTHTSGQFTFPIERWASTTPDQPMMPGVSTLMSVPWVAMQLQLPDPRGCVTVVDTWTQGCMGAPLWLFLIFHFCLSLQTSYHDVKKAGLMWSNSLLPQPKCWQDSVEWVPHFSYPLLPRLPWKLVCPSRGATAPLPLAVWLLLSLLVEKKINNTDYVLTHNTF